MSSTAATDSPETPAEGIIGQRQGPAFLPLFILAWFGVTIAFNGMMGAAIPKVVYLLGPESKDRNLAVITSIGGVVTLVLTPLFGRLSDRTRLGWGMRRPWMAGGAVVILAGALVLAYAHVVPLLVLGWCITQIGIAAVAMGQHTLLADQIPARIRARVSAATGVSAGVATVAGAAIIAALPQDQQAPWFLVPGTICLVLNLALCFGYRDARRTTPVEPLRAREILATYWLNPVRYKDFAWAWVCRFCITMSILTVSLFLLFLIIDSLGVPPERASAVQAVSYSVFVVANMVTTVLFGWISDRPGRRKTIVFSASALTVAGLVVAMLAGDQTMFLIGLGIVGAGQGAFISVDVAMMTELIPSVDDAGKDLGIVALSYQLPQVIGPIVGAWVVGLGGGSNYTNLFLFTIVLAALGALAVLPIKGVR